MLYLKYFSAIIVYVQNFLATLSPLTPPITELYKAE